MAYNNVLSRSTTSALIPEVVSNQILKGVQNDSTALTAFTKIPMSTNQTRMPILSALPTAYFVNGDTGLKQTTEVDWTNKYLNVEEIATIVPIPEAVLDDAEDSGYDVWGQVNPLISNAIARALDAAVFFGVNKPASWPADVVTSAVAASNTETRGTNAAATGGIAGDFSDLFGLVEQDGFAVDTVAAMVSYKGLLRQARATTGESLLGLNDQVSATAVYGVDLTYPMRGLWPTPASNSAEAVALDSSQFILGVRQDITMKVLDQAVIQDNTGAIIYNLAQQDMVAVRFVARFAWQVANVINYDNASGTTRYPAAVLRHS